MDYLYIIMLLKHYSIYNKYEHRLQRLLIVLMN